MQSRLQSPWSPQIGSRGDHRGRYEETPTLPGSFPADDSELPDRDEFEIHELPGTALDEIPELGSSISDVGFVFDSKMPHVAPAMAQENLPTMQKQQRQGSRDGKLASSSPTPPPPLPRSPNRLSTMPKQRYDARAGSGRAGRSSGKDASGTRSGVGSKDATNPASNNIVIAVFGLTGTGKSSFISKLTGKDVKIGHGLQSCTTGIEQVHCKIGLCDVTLVDTPGFDDTNRTDTEVLTLIASWMKDAYDDHTRLTGVIYLHRILDPRMSGSSYKNLRMLRSLCGTNNLSHVTLATTMWDMVDAEQGAAREGELLSEGKFWGDMVKAGSTVRRYDNTMGGAMALVNELLQKSPVVLKIQVEVAIEKKDLIDTTAGQSINETLIKMSKKHMEDLALIKQDIALAVKEKDAQLQEELEATKKKLADQMKAIEDSKKALRRPVVQRAWYQFSWRCKGCDARLKKDPNRKGPQPGKCPGCGLSQLFV